MFLLYTFKRFIGPETLFRIMGRHIFVHITRTILINIYSIWVQLTPGYMNHMNVYIVHDYSWSSVFLSMPFLLCGAYFPPFGTGYKCYTHIMFYVYIYISVFFSTIFVGYVFSQYPPYIAGWFFTFSLLSVLMHCFLLPPYGGRVRAACLHLYIFVYCFVAACL